MKKTAHPPPSLSSNDYSFFYGIPKQQNKQSDKKRFAKKFYCDFYKKGKLKSSKMHCLPNNCKTLKTCSLINFSLQIIVDHLKLIFSRSHTTSLIIR